MLLSDKATSASWRDRCCVCCIILLLKQAISLQHLHRMDILAWRRQNSPECLPLIMRGIKKPTPVSATLLLTHHDVLWAGGMSLSPSRSGVDSAFFSEIQHTEEVALRVIDASSICIKANTRAPSGRANTVVMGVIREIGSNITTHTGSLKPMSFYTSKCFPNVL